MSGGFYLLDAIHNQKLKAPPPPQKTTPSFPISMPPKVPPPPQMGVFNFPAREEKNQRGRKAGPLFFHHPWFSDLNVGEDGLPNAKNGQISQNALTTSPLPINLVADLCLIQAPHSGRRGIAGGVRDCQ